MFPPELGPEMLIRGGEIVGAWGRDDVAAAMLIIAAEQSRLDVASSVMD